MKVFPSILMAVFLLLPVSMAQAASVESHSSLGFTLTTNASDPTDYIFGSGSSFNNNSNAQGSGTASVAPAPSLISDVLSVQIDAVGQANSGPLANSSGTFNLTHSVFLNITNISSTAFEIDFDFDFSLSAVLLAFGLPLDVAFSAYSMEYSDSEGGQFIDSDSLTLEMQPVASPGLLQSAYQRNLTLELAPNDGFDFSVGFALNGNVNTLSDLPPIPLPAALPLVLAGLGVLAAARAARDRCDPA